MRSTPLTAPPFELISTSKSLSARTTVPPCKFRINNRCVLKFDHIDLPSDEKQGTVTLTAQVSRRRLVFDVNVVDANKGGSEAERFFAAQATRNLTSWRFERSQNKEDIRIVYRLERVAMALDHGINAQLDQRYFIAVFVAGEKPIRARTVAAQTSPRLGVSRLVSNMIFGACSHSCFILEHCRHFAGWTAF
jgi:hypothetical protein